MEKPLVTTVIFLTLIIANIGYASDNTSVSVTATVISHSSCTFGSKTVTLNFGNLDPGNPIDTNQSTSITFSCRSNQSTVTFFISGDDGLYETGPNAARMRNTTVTTQYLPYSFTLSPTSGTVPKNTNQTLTITGTVKGVDYSSSYGGNYSDTVTIAIIA